MPLGLKAGYAGLPQMSRAPGALGSALGSRMPLGQSGPGVGGYFPRPPSSAGPRPVPNLRPMPMKQPQMGGGLLPLRPGSGRPPLGDMRPGGVVQPRQPQRSPLNQRVMPLQPDRGLTRPGLMPNGIVQ
jgi:hypothetical protein